MTAGAVIVYRASPSQKAEVIRSVRRYCPKLITCAIGDGANDVNMIQTAHVGIGIMGNEGTYAASNSDFAIRQFKDLRRLLFWHGSNFAFNLTTYIPLTFAKTMLSAISHVIFCFYNGFTAV